MAATDQHYRSQRTLDLVFGVTSLLMLIVIVIMFAKDYYRPFKVEQRVFADVEAAVAERSLIDLLPHNELREVRQAADAVKTADRNKTAGYRAATEKRLTAEGKLADLKARVEELKKDKDEKALQAAEDELKAAEDLAKAAAADQQAELAKLETPNLQRLAKAEAAFLAWLHPYVSAERKKKETEAEANRVKEANAEKVRIAQAEKAKSDSDYRSIKAEYDSKESLYYIERDLADAATGARQQSLRESVQDQKSELDELRARLDAAKRDLEAKTQALTEALAVQAKAEARFVAADDAYKKLRDKFDRALKLYQDKQFDVGDAIRALPVIDGFASPYKIHQYTLDKLPIDYSFKYVTRYDRCATCHLGMEKGDYTEAALTGIVDFEKKKPSVELQRNLDLFVRLIQERPDGERGGFDVSKLPKRVTGLSEKELTPGRVEQFAAHPRLDLFVDPTSPHPAEKFGCTICHAGQGSATTFAEASHTPNRPEQREDWTKERGWFHNHYWDYPMLASRFSESSCLKCHHEVTDLVRYGNKQEAPKLLKGYNLVRELGCFGCHEIAGIKGGRRVGPDMRLEPGVPLEQMNPADRAKVEADVLNPPGTMRKVGPSLYRIAEKTNAEWMRKWLESPRHFRPDTRMPHFYGLSTNSAEALAGTDQSAFPAAEIHAIIHYLVRESESYLAGNDLYRRTNLARQKQIEEEIKAGKSGDALNNELKAVLQNLEKAQSLALELEKEKPGSVKDQIIDGEGRPVKLPELPKDADRKQHLKDGRFLFTTKGCLGCHAHSATTRDDGTGLPNDAVSHADFGPDLSRIAAKLGNKPGDDSARRWLVQWILNPNVHFPRTRMPITHLTPEQASDIALWLLDVSDKDWKAEDVPAPSEDTLKAMVRVYLQRVAKIQQVGDLLDPKDDEAKKRAKEWLAGVKADADEAILADGLTKDNMLLYVGKKSISRLGCFGCHNVPGFEMAKPIGTPLNDWGKKDPERLAFEDGAAFVHENFYLTDRTTDEDGQPYGPRLEKAHAAGGHGESQAESEAVKTKWPYETFFYEALEHHQRDGFLHLKLTDPRSYDFHRDRAWDDRLRMPQFKFAHVRRLPNESDDDYLARTAQEEAAAREAVMTFVLGLVAEPIPEQYVHRPNRDTLAVVKGRQVLDKFNCGGCHQLNAGVFEFKDDDATAKALLSFYKPDTLKEEITFPRDNAWTGLPSPWPGRLQIFGMNPRIEIDPEDDNPDESKRKRNFVTRLVQAVRFYAPDDVKRKNPLSLPAGLDVYLPPENLVSPPRDQVADATKGGAFVETLIPFLNKYNSTIYKVDSGAQEIRTVLPPPLLRQGQRVQPEWLFQFLRNPHEVRPATLLRMPKFNMSDADARVLADYFSALDKISNPGIGLEYPYVSTPPQDERYWRQVNEAYKKRLGPKLEERAKQMQPIWEQVVRERVEEARSQLGAAEAAVKEATDPAVKTAAENRLKELTTTIRDGKAQQDKKDYSKQRQDWEDRVYFTDAYRMITYQKSICLTCHQIGDIVGSERKGPNLGQVSDRLRADWALHWIGNPERMFAYKPTMPANFTKESLKEFGQFFEGTSAEQATAARDVLMNFPKVAAMPENRYFRRGSGGGK